jgi:hypothetical protein
MEPAIDISANLTLIVNKMKEGYYKKRARVQAHLFTTFQAVHDGHLRFRQTLWAKSLLFADQLRLSP